MAYQSFCLLLAKLKIFACNREDCSSNLFVLDCRFSANSTKQLVGRDVLASRFQRDREQLKLCLNETILFGNFKVEYIHMFILPSILYQEISSCLLIFGKSRKTSRKKFSNFPSSMKCLGLARRILTSPSILPIKICRSI